MTRAVPMYEVEVYLPSGWKRVSQAQTPEERDSCARLFAKVPDNHGVRTVTRRGGRTRYAVLRAPDDNMTPVVGLDAMESERLTLGLIRRAAILSVLMGVSAVFLGIALRASDLLGW